MQRIYKLLIVFSFLLCSQTTLNASTPIYTDDFDFRDLDFYIWNILKMGSGTSLSEENTKYEIFLPSFSNGGTFASGYNSCQLSGDFDVQVDYELPIWPTGNGVRVGLGATALNSSHPIFGPTNWIVERTSFGSAVDYPSYLREVYLTDFASSVNGVVGTSDVSGTLRLARTGNSVTGYYFSSGSWVPIYSSSITTGDVFITLSAWSHDYAFTSNDVKLSLDNFLINKGYLICQGKIAVPIDIKPGVSPNILNIGSNGNIPVAILSTNNFDATTINTTTITLYGASVALKMLVASASYEDVDGDGLLDMLVQVTTDALQLSNVDKKVTLIGKTVDGKDIIGFDSVRVVQ